MMRKVNVFFNWLILLAIIFLSIFSVLSYVNYRKTINRTQNPPSLTMAQTPVDMLNDTPKQVAIKKDFLITYNKLGDNAPNKSQLTQLKRDLKQIKTAHGDYANKWRTLKARYDVVTNLKSIFVFGKVNKSPQTIKKTINKVNSNLNYLYSKNRHSEFVKKQVAIVKKLRSDSYILNEVANKLTGIATVKHHVWYLTQSATTQNYDVIYKKLDKLNYHWNYLNNFEGVQDSLNKALDEQTSVIDKYNNYLRDMHDKEKAYSDWESQRQARRQQYEKDQEAKREEKLEREREKQREAEQERKEESELDDSTNDKSDSTSDDSSSVVKSTKKQSKSNTTSDNQTDTDSNSASQTKTPSSNSSSSSQSKLPASNNNKQQNTNQNKPTNNDTASDIESSNANISEDTDSTENSN